MLHDRAHSLLALVLGMGIVGCAATGPRGAPFVIVDTKRGERIEFAAFIDRIDAADVVFLGECGFRVLMR